MKLEGVGMLTGWGRGVAALPEDARTAAGGRRVIPLLVPRPGGDRLRRATRECLLGVAAVDALLRETGLDRATITGSRTALIYVTAGAYAASNRTFLAAAGTPGALHFPYTAASAVPAEVTIEFGLTGPYVILIGGAAATIDAFGQAHRLMADGACDRALVLAVETFEECADLYARARWLLGRPLVEAAACALLAPDGRGWAVRPAADPSPLELTVARRAGETLACGPLIALALAAAAGDDPWTVSGQWRGRRAAVAAS